MVFVVMVLKDTVRIEPRSLGEDISITIHDHLHKKYSNKVLDGHGLCVCVQRIDSRSDGFVHNGDGRVHIQVVFRMVVFQPFRGEIMVGKVRKSDETGMLVSVGFFEHIFIPADQMPDGSIYDRTEKLWAWTYSGHDLWMDLQEHVRFRITDVLYGEKPRPNEDMQGAPTSSDDAAAQAAAEEKAKERTLTIADFMVRPPLRIMASILDEDGGLGLLRWWNNDQNKEGEEESGDDEGDEGEEEE